MGPDRSRLGEALKNSKDKNSLKIKQNTKATGKHSGKVRSTWEEKK